MTLATLGGILMAGSLDLITIFLGLELLALPSYVLAGMLKKRHSLARSIHQVSLDRCRIIRHHCFSAFRLLYGAAGTTNLQAIAEQHSEPCRREFALLSASGSLPPCRSRRQSGCFPAAYVGSGCIRRLPHPGECVLDYRVRGSRLCGPACAFCLSLCRAGRKIGRSFWR